jgi:hypothetical protein
MVMTTQARISIAVVSVLTLLISVGQPLSRHKQQSAAEGQESMQSLTILRDEQLRVREPERVIKAIEQLGQMKSIAAIDDLVQLLTFKQSFPWENRNLGMVEEDHPITPLSRYPAAGALFQIGRPALPVLIKVVEAEETGSLASENAIYTVTQIFRDSPAGGVEYLRDAAAKASSAQAARRLSGAADRVKRFHQQ